MWIDWCLRFVGIAALFAEWLAQCVCVCVFECIFCTNRASGLENICLISWVLFFPSLPCFFLLLINWVMKKKNGWKRYLQIKRFYLISLKFYKTKVLWFDWTVLWQCLLTFNNRVWLLKSLHIWTKQSRKSHLTLGGANFSIWKYQFIAVQYVPFYTMTQLNSCIIMPLQIFAHFHP